MLFEIQSNELIVINWVLILSQINSQEPNKLKLAVAFPKQIN
jgi:hypothetical protein